MDRRLKVAIVTAFPHNAEAPRGGVESVSVNLVSALTAFQDLDVHVVTTERGRQTVGEESWKGVRVYRLPQKHRRDGSYCNRFFNCSSSAARSGAM